MPIAILALTIAAYAIGTTEFVIVGLLPTVATDLNVTLPLAGLIVSVYALGVTFGAPVLTALTGRIERKPLLIGLMALFIVGNAAAALSPSYEPLLVAASFLPLPMACSSRSARPLPPTSYRKTAAPRPLP
ncbi:Major Facilitator Superfamily protein [Ensifer sp. OV372]|nr:Major Facilitator Superfamily protein [Ensifer sp. OV372]